LIVENTFTSISDTIDHIMPYLSYFKKLILRISWNSVDRISNIRVPILFIVGVNDKVVPTSHASRLYDTAKYASFKQIY
jgi:fermentation-respiration switch protein FrsA (DUF1100 family)